MRWPRTSARPRRSTRPTLPSRPPTCDIRTGRSPGMSVSVRIPTILRTYTEGASEVTAEGGTLGTVIDDLDANYLGIKGRILDEGGQIRRFVNVYVGNDDVRFLDNLETPTPDGTQISVIPAVA